MKLPSPRPVGVPADMLPILNVVLLLLVFFMMLARLGVPAPADAALPRSAMAERADAAAPLLRLAADGTLHAADGQTLTEADLAGWLRRSGATRVQLQARKEASAPRVLAILALLRAGGAERVQLLVVQPA